MGKSSKSVSLVLIGSALFLAGCSWSDDDDQNNQTGVHTGGHVAPHFRVGSGSSSSGAGGPVSSGVSARGGFGLSGHAPGG